VLTEAVAETKSLDHDKLAAYIHKAKFNTVAGNLGAILTVRVST
jgi:hypothetical protein